MNVGIDEKRAREIYQEMNLQLRRDYSQEALEIAKSRVEEFENRLMPKMAEVEGALGAFADPGFQLLLTEAQKTAASTERPADYDLLSELLIHRFKSGENRVTRAGISRAVEILDEVSDEALLALTVVHAVGNFIPLSGIFDDGLNVLNNLFGSILYGELPSTHDWIDHLDVLDAVRVNPVGGLKKIGEYYPEALHGYVDVGIKKNSDAHRRALEIINGGKFVVSPLIDHHFNDEYLRVPVSSRNGIKSLSFNISYPYEGSVVRSVIGLSDDQIKDIHSIYDLYEVDGSVLRENINLFMTEWAKRENLKKVGEWWDSISIGFSLTSVGKVLAHSNAQRCDKSLPPIA